MIMVVHEYIRVWSDLHVDGAIRPLLHGRICHHTIGWTDGDFFTEATISLDMHSWKPSLNHSPRIIKGIM
jgi:hypothetical protein